MANWELKEKSTGDLTVTIEGDEWKKAVDKAFKKLCRNLEIDGFRKGSVPVALAQKRIPAGQRYIQAVDDNANEWMRRALAEMELEPISQPTLDIKDVDADKCELVFTFTVAPEAKLGDYKSLKYEVESWEVTDEDIDKEISRMRESYAELEVKEGEAEEGDTVNIDYKGFKDGVAFEGGEAQGHDLKLGSNSFIPGFEEQLIGVKEGDEKELNLTFPEEYHSADLAGADVVFNVKVNEVKTTVIPELDDDFASALNMKGVETVADLTKNVRDRLETRKKNEAESKAEQQLMEDLADIVEADIPDVMVEDEVQGQINQLANQIQSYGMSLTSYLQMMGQTAEQLKESYREQAEKTVKLRLGLEAIGKAENLVPTDEEIEDEFKKIADQYSMEVDQVKSMISVEMLKNDLRNMKAVDFLKGTSAAEEAAAE